MNEDNAKLEKLIGHVRHRPAALARLPEILRARLDVTQQCRADDLPMVEAAYRGTGIKTEIGKFFTDLPRRMAAAHLVIARSGASHSQELSRPVSQGCRQATRPVASGSRISCHQRCQR